MLYSVGIDTVHNKKKTNMRVSANSFIYFYLKVSNNKLVPKYTCAQRSNT